jgi:UDP-N-acetylmuramoyl-tripeptide--D-alanyl-D-alanine ligase
MAAAGLACLVGCEPRLVWQALGSCKTSWGRGQWVPLKSGARLLFDGYNANPDSMAAALAAFSQLPTERGGRRIVLLAEMRELGQESAACHEELGERAARGGFSAVGFYGPSAGAFRSGFLKAGGNEKNLFISDVYEITLASKWGLVLHPQDLLLIKGSRGMRTEKLVAQLDPVAASEWPP